MDSAFQLWESIPTQYKLVAGVFAIALLCIYAFNKNRNDNY